MAKTIFASNELGSRITIVATRNIGRGEIVSINGIIGVATNPIRTGKSGTLLTEGIFEVEKIDSEMEMLVGSNAYLQGELATSVQNMTYLGKVVEDSDPGETSVRIKISTGTQNSIVSLTLSELETLISNSELNKGLQYDVTDKGWLLYANSSNTLKPLSGKLTILNGDIIPEGIVPDEIELIVFADGTLTEIELIVPSGIYLPAACTFYDMSAINDTLSVFDGTFRAFLQAANDGAVRLLTLIPVAESASLVEGFILGSNGVFSGKANIFFKRLSEYTPPIPQIVSAETDESGHVIIVFSHPMDWGQDFYYNLFYNDEEVSDSYTNTDDRTMMLDTVVAQFGDVIKLSIPYAGATNIWGGFHPEVIDYPVVNNTIEIVYPVLLSAVATKVWYDYWDCQVLMEFSEALDEDSVAAATSTIIFKVNGVSKGTPAGSGFITPNKAQYSINIDNLSPSDVVTFTTGSEYTIMSAAGVALQPVVDFPVTNNVPA